MKKQLLTTAAILALSATASADDLKGQCFDKALEAANSFRELNVSKDHNSNIYEAAELNVLSANKQLHGFRVVDFSTTSGPVGYQIRVETVGFADNPCLVTSIQMGD